MDRWDFRTWRKRLGFTQTVAAEKLGLSRGAVQYWESQVRPVPLAVELACRELTHHWKRGPEFGPVILLYGDHAETETLPGPNSVLMRAERHPNNDCALRSASGARDGATLFLGFIVEDDGNVIWSGADLLDAIDARKTGGRAAQMSKT